MNTTEIIGYKRANLGKKSAKKLRLEGNAPCVLYGGSQQIHFYVPIANFKPLVYTSQAYFVSLRIEDATYSCMLKDTQFHPVNDMILHADFFLLLDNKKIKMDIPINILGRAKGVERGGVLQKKIRQLPIYAYPKDMPAHIDIDVSALDLNKTYKVQDIIVNSQYTILASLLTSIASVEVPRALRGKQAEEDNKESK